MWGSPQEAGCWELGLMCSLINGGPPLGLAGSAMQIPSGDFAVFDVQFNSA